SVAHCRGRGCGHYCAGTAAAPLLLAPAQSAAASLALLCKLRGANGGIFLRAMRTSCRRLPPLLSPRYCRHSRFLPELGLEVLRHHRLARDTTLAPNECVSRRPARSLSAPGAPLLASEHFVFLRRDLRN